MTNKELCEQLRILRLKVEQELGLKDVVRKTPCKFSGECLGTCPACEAEERMLLEEILKSRKLGNGSYKRPEKPVSGFGDEEGLGGDTGFGGTYDGFEVPYTRMEGLVVPGEGLVVPRYNHMDTLPGKAVAPENNEDTSNKKDKKSSLALSNFLNKGNKK